MDTAERNKRADVPSQPLRRVTWLSQEQGSGAHFAPIWKAIDERKLPVLFD